MAEKPTADKKSADKPAKEKRPAKRKGEKPKGEKGEKGAAGAAAPQGKAPTPRLQERYYKEILPGLREKLGRKNILSLPRLEKIVINMGVGQAITDKKYMEDAVAALAQIAGQKPIVRKSRKAVANFKLREGMEIGCKVTLRGARMYEFLDRLVSLALPRVRDFRGLNPNAFDGHGNYNLGLTEQLVFPELNPDKYTRPQGMNITLCISGSSNNDSLELLKGFGMPFKVDEVKGKAN